MTQTGTYVGAVVGPVVFGALVEHGSYPLAWACAAGMSLVGAAATWVGRSLLRQRRALLASAAPDHTSFPL